MKLGDRVRLKDDLDIFNLGSFPKGATGTVAWALDPLPKETDGIVIFSVKLDEPFADLDQWDNELQVWGEDAGEVTVDSFEVVYLRGEKTIVVRLITGDDLWEGGVAGWYRAELEAQDEFGEEVLGDTEGPFNTEAEARAGLGGVV